jgi:hypothetical protein
MGLKLITGKVFYIDTKILIFTNYNLTIWKRANFYNKEFSKASYLPSKPFAQK